MDRCKFLKYLMLLLVIVYFVITPMKTFSQGLPISYYYTNPLQFPNYSYFNSITDPFYYLGYGYKKPILGNDLLAANTYDPFLNYYQVYLFGQYGINTYPYVSYTEQIPFPYQALPGTFLPYSSPFYPTYTYGLVDNYYSWINSKY
jgi:hypothetical protein